MLTNKMKGKNMSNVVMILAGGVGSRVGASIPKQFIKVNNRPIIAYTIDIFEHHAEIDAIEIVCIKNYLDYIKELIISENFKKVKLITEGGSDFQASVINGLQALDGKLVDSDNLLIHYAASPMTSADVVSDAIRVCNEKGNASPARSQIYLACKKNFNDGSTQFVNRDEIMCLNSPQALKYGYVKRIYSQAEDMGLLGNVEPHTTSLMLAMGEKIFFSKDNSLNIKITTQEDLDVFRDHVLVMTKTPSKQI